MCAFVSEMTQLVASLVSGFALSEIHLFLINEEVRSEGT